jgi:uncharacterized protein
LIIDADAHVVETERTWDFMDDQRYRPQLVALPDATPRPFVWVVDGKVRFRVNNATLSPEDLLGVSDQLGRNVVTEQSARELRDVSARVQHMDQLGIDVEVLHNSFFIHRVSFREEAEVPICRGYNRWVADIWQQGNGRLYWTLVPPVTNIAESLEEIRFGKDHGAVGVALRGIELDRTLMDPYFYPLYEEAQRLDLPIVLHTGCGNARYVALFESPNAPAAGLLAQFNAPSVVFCHQLMMSDLPDRFPTLRWGIVEAGSQWLPWVIHDVQQRYKAAGRKWPEEGFAAFRTWVTCMTNEDMPFIMKYAGEDRLMIGTDYGHTDPSAEVDALDVFRRTSGLEPYVVQKVLSDNPKALYGLHD